jgi:hypothetical protein
MCNISTTIPRNLYDYVDDMHWRERRSIASIVRDAIRDWALARGWEDCDTLFSQDSEAQ